MKYGFQSEHSPIWLPNFRAGNIYMEYELTCADGAE
jgi:hypothetical protein